MSAHPERDQRADHRNEHRLRSIAVGPDAAAIRIVLARLAALRATSHLDVHDPTEIGGWIEGTAHSARVSGRPETFATIAAFAIAGLENALRADELRVDSGGEAA